MRTSHYNGGKRSRRVIQNRIKDGTVKVSPNNTNLVLINSVIDWLNDVEVPASKNATVAQNDPVTETIPAAIDPELPEVSVQQADSLPSEADKDWEEKLSSVLEVLRANPDITDEELATALGLKTLEMARFWKVNAQMILQRGSVVEKSNGHAREEINLAEFPELLV